MAYKMIAFAFLLIGALFNTACYFISGASNDLSEAVGEFQVIPYFEHRIKLDIVNFETKYFKLMIINNSEFGIWTFGSLPDGYSEGISPNIDFHNGKEWRAIQHKAADARFAITTPGVGWYRYGVHPSETFLINLDISHFNISDGFDSMRLGLYRIRLPFFFMRSHQISDFNMDEATFQSLVDPDDYGRFDIVRGHTLIVEFFWDGDEIQQVR